MKRPKIKDKRGWGWHIKQRILTDGFEPDNSVLEATTLPQPVPIKYFKWANLGLFLLYFQSFQAQILQKNLRGIVGVEGEHADHFRPLFDHQTELMTLL